MVRGCGFPDDSGIEEERAGGAGGGPEQDDRAGSGPTTSIRSTGGALTDRMTAETLRVRADNAGHCMCDLHMHMGRYDHAEVVLTLFGSIRFQSYAVELQIRISKGRIKGTATSVAVSSFELNQCVLLLHLGIWT